jgi:hypothetical protein
MPVVAGAASDGVTAAVGADGVAGATSGVADLPVSGSALVSWLNVACDGGKYVVVAPLAAVSETASAAME